MEHCTRGDILKKAIVVFWGIRPQQISTKMRVSAKMFY